MTILQREKIQTLTSLAVFIKLRAKHLSMYLSNYTNKHLTFHKGEYVGHLEPTVMDDTTIGQRETHQTNSVTLKKMMAETVTPDTFIPPHHKLSQLSNMNSMPYYRNMNPTLQRIKLQLELHLSPA